MRAEPDESWTSRSRTSRFPLVELLLAAAVIGALVFFWFWSAEKEPQPTVVELPSPAAPPAAAPELPATPDIPRRPEPVPASIPEEPEEDTADATVEVEATEPVVSPLTAEEGDALLRRQLAAAGANTLLLKLVSGEHPLEKTAAVIDGSGRGIMLRAILSADTLKPPFSVTQEGATLFMSTASYSRYDRYTDALAALDTRVLVETFHKLRRLYENAFEQLGLDPDDFDNAVIRTLDLVLATPEIEGPVELRTKSVVYIFADPALESLPALQKQLLRMGPDNLRRIKQQARLLREGLLAQ